MGKGKGSFDHWASRIAVSKVIFELKGDIHEQVARDAFRIAGNKMPGQFWRLAVPGTYFANALKQACMNLLKKEILRSLVLQSWMVSRWRS